MEAVGFEEFDGGDDMGDCIWGWKLVGLRGWVDYAEGFEVAEVFMVGGFEFEVVESWTVVLSGASRDRVTKI